MHMYTFKNDFIWDQRACNDRRRGVKQVHCSLDYINLAILKFIHIYHPFVYMYKLFSIGAARLQFVWFRGSAVLFCFGVSGGFGGSGVLFWLVCLVGLVGLVCFLFVF